MKEEIEPCCSCNKELPYSKNKEVDSRGYYIQGAGDLCHECYNRIYGSDIHIGIYE